MRHPCVAQVASGAGFSSGNCFRKVLIEVLVDDVDGLEVGYYIAVESSVTAITSFPPSPPM